MMQAITVSADMESKLGDATGQTALCDEAGRVLGLFSPLPSKPNLDVFELENPLPIEVIRELRKSLSTGKPLEEILKRLEL
jgi:hypothetical protein